MPGGDTKSLFFLNRSQADSERTCAGSCRKKESLLSDRPDRIPKAKMRPRHVLRWCMATVPTGPYTFLFGSDATGHTAPSAKRWVLSSAVQKVPAHCGDLVRGRVVISSDASPRLPFPDHLTGDTQSQLQRSFQAIAEGLYLVCPDGYLAFRSIPADADAVLAHLDQMFRAAAEAVGP